jgi:hypothetical protein
MQMTPCEAVARLEAIARLADGLNQQRNVGPRKNATYTDTSRRSVTSHKHEMELSTYQNNRPKVVMHALLGKISGKDPRCSCGVA